MALLQSPDWVMCSQHGYQSKQQQINWVNGDFAAKNCWKWNL